MVYVDKEICQNIPIQLNYFIRFAILSAVQMRKHTAAGTENKMPSPPLPHEPLPYHHHPLLRSHSTPAA